MTLLEYAVGAGNANISASCDEQALADQNG